MEPAEQLEILQRPAVTTTTTLQQNRGEALQKARESYNGSFLVGFDCNGSKSDGASPPQQKEGKGINSGKASYAHLRGGSYLTNDP